MLHFLPVIRNYLCPSAKAMPFSTLSFLVYCGSFSTTEVMLMVETTFPVLKSILRINEERKTLAKI